MRDFKSRVCKFFIFGYLCVLNFKKGHKKANVIDLVAQSVEHYTFNVRVLGSNPSGITTSASGSISWGIFVLELTGELMGNRGRKWYFEVEKLIKEGCYSFA